MDRRIMKTKAGLKDAVRRLLTTERFEDITVTEICDEAKTGRLTFYKYYSDKSDLLKECFLDLEKDIEARYDREKPAIERETAELAGSRKRLEGLMIRLQHFYDAVMDAMESVSVPMEKVIGNSGMLEDFLRFIIGCLEKIEAEEGKLRQDSCKDGRREEGIRVRYPASRFNAFLTLGMWGFIYESGEGTSGQDIRRDARHMIRDVISSGLFVDE